MNPKRMPFELLNELFGSLPLKNVFGLLAKMPNVLLARNAQKMLESIKITMKMNKMNVEDCGPKLEISDDGLIVIRSADLGYNSVRAVLPIPAFNLMNINKSIITFYFEVQILNKSNRSDVIGFCDQQFPLEFKCLGWANNSIGIWRKGGIYIDDIYSKFGNVNPAFIEGDFIGLGIIKLSNSKIECFATCNGELLGKIELPPKFATIKLFPALNLGNVGDSIKVNFGKDEWTFKEFGRVLA